MASPWRAGQILQWGESGDARSAPEGLRRAARYWRGRRRARFSRGRAYDERRPGHLLGLRDLDSWSISGRRRNWPAVLLCNVPSHAPGKRFLVARDRTPRTASEAVLLPSRDCKPPCVPAKPRVFVKPREISVSVGVRGGAGRTRTGNQTVIRSMLQPQQPASSGSGPHERGSDDG